MPINYDTYVKRFHKNYTINPDNQCWIWNKALRVDGYPNTRWGDLYGGHRVSYLIHNNINPGNHLICHTCDTPACVNPAHLFLGSPQTNSDDKVAKGRQLGAVGIKNASAKLTEDQIQEIRSKYIPYKVTCQQLADEYGVSMQNIWFIIKQIGWTHVK